MDDLRNIIAQDLTEMRSQLVDCFPNDQEIIEAAPASHIVVSVARTFGMWDTGDRVLTESELFAASMIVAH